MTPPAHLASGYILYKALKNRSKLKLVSKEKLLSVFLIGSMLPDIDGLFGKQLYNHRYTLFHAPLFWIAILLVSLILKRFTNLKKTYYFILIFVIGAIMHIFLDWFSGRTAGIMIFYPFSKNIYSLFSLNPEKGMISVIPDKQHLSFWLFYTQNKFLLTSEIFVVIAAFVLFLEEKMQSLRQ